MAVVVGIDEAGYGPLLGPLVVSSTAFVLPAELVSADLWETLSKAVSKKKSHLGGRLLVADSKKAYTPASGVKHLRRTVLAYLACIDGRSRPPETAGQLFETLCSHCRKRLGDYPWYQGLDEKPLGFDINDIEVASTVLNRTMTENSIRPLDISSRCLDVGYYNRMVSTVKNKASVLFTAVCSLIQQAVRKHRQADNEPMQFIVDRQGGRSDYTQPLQTMLDPAELKIVRCDQKISSYKLTISGKAVRIHFATAADDKYLPVSLASMTGKYLRQILIECMNQYFTGHCSGLKPTAGYWQDGQRFIKELDEKFAHVKYDSNLLIRCR